MPLKPFIILVGLIYLLSCLIASAGHSYPTIDTFVLASSPNNIYSTLDNTIAGRGATASSVYISLFKFNINSSPTGHKWFLVLNVTGNGSSGLPTVPMQIWSMPNHTWDENVTWNKINISDGLDKGYVINSSMATLDNNTYNVTSFVESEIANGSLNVSFEVHPQSYESQRYITINATESSYNKPTLIYYKDHGNETFNATVFTWIDQGNSSVNHDGDTDMVVSIDKNGNETIGLAKFDFTDLFDTQDFLNNYSITSAYLLSEANGTSTQYALTSPLYSAATFNVHTVTYDTKPNIVLTEAIDEATIRTNDTLSNGTKMWDILPYIRLIYNEKSTNMNFAIKSSIGRIYKGVNLTNPRIMITWEATDTIKPSVDIISPVNMTFFKNWTIYSVKTNEPVVGCNYSLDGSPNVAMTTEWQHNDKIWHNNFSYLSNGTHTINFNCVDAAGNQNSTATNTFNIDTVTDTYIPTTNQNEWLKEPIYIVNLNLMSGAKTYAHLETLIPTLKQLGVKTIYLTPIFNMILGSGASVINHSELNPSFGNASQFKSLINTTHNNSMKIILDVIPSYYPPEVVFFENNEWFWKNEDGTRHFDRYGFSSDVTASGYIQTFVNQIIPYVTDYNIDGFRIDSPQMMINMSQPGNPRSGDGAIPNSTLVKLERNTLGEELIQQLSYTLNQTKPSAIIYPEWYGFLCELQPTNCIPQFDKYVPVAYDWPYYSFSINNIVTRIATSQQLVTYINNEVINYGKTRSMWVENQDTDRIYSIYPNQSKGLFVLTAMLPGVPMLFAGVESQETVQNAFNTTINTSSSSWLFYQKVLSIRNNSSALKYGTLANVLAVPVSGIYAFSRVNGNDTKIIITNMKNTTINATLSLPIYPGDILYDNLTGYSYNISNPSAYNMLMPGSSSKILTCIGECIPLIAPSWWNSKTQDTKLYIPVNSGESVTFGLIYTNLGLSNTWILNGSSTTETSKNYTYTFNTQNEIYYVTGTNGLFTVTWIVPVKSAKQSIPLSLMTLTQYLNLTNAIQLHDPTAFLNTIVLENTNIFGNIFYVLIWGAVFGAFWIHKGSITIPSTLGLIFGALIIGTLPADYQLVAQFMISAGVIIVLFLLFKERR